MSQPGASKLLAELEGLFGTTLFTRTATGVVATAACELLLEHTEAILSELDFARSEIAPDGAVSPVLRVGANAISVRLHLMPVLQQFHERHSSAQVQIVEGLTGNLLELLRLGKIDLALAMLGESAIRNGTLRGISHRMLPAVEWVIAANKEHPLARKRKIPPQDLERCRWALSPPGSLVRAAFDQAFYSAGLRPPRPCIEAAPFTTMLSIVHATDAVTVVPRSAVASEIGGRLTILQTNLKITPPLTAVFYKPGALVRTHVRSMFGLLDGTESTARRPE